MVRGMYGRGCAWQGYAWQGMCMAEGACVVGACMAGGKFGRVGMISRGRACMEGVHGEACVQDRRPLKRAVHILLECILVKGKFCLPLAVQM